jgi:hypothetical protein
MISLGKENPMVNLDQVRANRAFREALRVAQGGAREGYLRLARTLPAMFQNNGFLATWAFLLSKEKGTEPHYGFTLKIMVEHLRDVNLGLQIPDGLNAYSLFAAQWTNPTNPIGGDELMRLTRESIVFSGWLKRGAEAFCDQ